MLKILAEGFMLGLATGSVCLVTCTPIYLPYLLSEERKLIKSIGVIAEISAGRFFSYIAFGAFAGYVGANISQINRTLFSSIAYILLSIYLILSAVRTRQHDRKCHVPKFANITKSAFILGILTGISFCPPFLIALSKAVNLGGVVSGMMLFLGFFVGTTLYLIPIAFIGQLSRIKIMKKIGQVASLVIAAWFIFSGIRGLIQLNKQHGHVEFKLTGNERLVDVFAPDQQIIILFSDENAGYFMSLRDSFANRNKQHVLLLPNNAESVDSLLKYEKSIVFYDKEIDDGKFKSLLHNFDVFYIEENYRISRMLTFLNKFTFKTETTLQWDFEEH
ncbi:MAG TPA: sulfite exporter TauE/SafE family protein [Candidatus Cloacimonetes bacterium]|nr:sulfite exporter TauE/SafE family protein [Candidatus Cloacimonadota bacterium]